MTTRVVLFPFDLFGNAGTAAGVDLLGDELREILADNRRETVPTRARAYTDHVRLQEFTFATLPEYNRWRQRGRQAVRKVLDANERLLWITGNHLGALPVYDELAGRDDVLIVQLDAHLDIHHFADCTKEPSHGNFLLHVAGPLPPLVNLGHRELLLLPDYVEQHYRKTFAAADLAVDARPALDFLRKASRKADKIFLDLDCDVFDPAFFPAVGQPVPFGLSPQQVLMLLDAAWSPKVAGVIVSEFDPARDRDDRALATLTWLLEHFLLRFYEGEG